MSGRHAKRAKGGAAHSAEKHGAAKHGAAASQGGGTARSAEAEKHGAGRSAEPAAPTLWDSSGDGQDGGGQSPFETRPAFELELEAAINAAFGDLPEREREPEPERAFGLPEPEPEPEPERAFEPASPFSPELPELFAASTPVLGSLETTAPLSKLSEGTALASAAPPPHTPEPEPARAFEPPAPECIPAPAPAPTEGAAPAPASAPAPEPAPLARPIKPLKLPEVAPPPEAAAPVPVPPFLIDPPRRRHVWPLVICAIVVFVAVTGGLTYLNRWLLVEQADERAAVQQTGNGYLDESIALIQEADSVIVELDKASASRITEEDIPRLEALIDQVGSAQESLDGAIAKARRAQETFWEDERKELAQHAEDAATYRKQMLEMSSHLVGYDIAAMKSALSLEYAWTLIVGADADMRAAVETVIEGGSGAVTESRDYNQEALDKLALAEDALDAAVETLPTVDLTVLRDYLSTKTASAELALASDEAFLEGDYDTANTRNEEFIAKDAEAVRLAASIPSDPLSLVVTAYEEATDQLRGDYKVIRSHAADSDVYLRAYLGVDIQQGAQDAQGAQGAQGDGSGQQ